MAHVRSSIRLLLLALGLAGASACRLTDHSERSEGLDADVLEFPESGYEQGDPSKLPAFAFDSTEKSMGRLAQGEQVERTFHFTNSGGKDLLITDVRGTCGCTVGKDWPRRPVPPGASGTITVRFDSEGRSGVQNKSVTVVANTQPPTTVLLLKGEVIAPKSGAHE